MPYWRGRVVIFDAFCLIFLVLADPELTLIVCVFPSHFHFCFGNRSLHTIDYDWFRSYAKGNVLGSPYNSTCELRLKVSTSGWYDISLTDKSINRKFMYRKFCLNRLNRFEPFSAVIEITVTAHDGDYSPLHLYFITFHWNEKTLCFYTSYLM